MAAGTAAGGPNRVGPGGAWLNWVGKFCENAVNGRFCATTPHWVHSQRRRMSSVHNNEEKEEEKVEEEKVEEEEMVIVSRGEEGHLTVLLLCILYADSLKYLL